MTTTMRTIIIEDEKPSRTQLKRMLGKLEGQVELVGEAADITSGLELIQAAHPDLALLDICLSHRTAFELLEQISEISFEIIFVSGYDQYGLQAVKCSALDYILKPVRQSDLALAIHKAGKRMREKNTAGQIANMLAILNQSQKKDHRIALPMMKEIRYVLPSDIIRCEARNNYTRFHLASGEILLISRGLYEFEKTLSFYGFIRCHHSHMVNRSFIRSLLTKDYVHEFQLLDGNRIPITKQRLAMSKNVFDHGKQ